MSGNFEVVSNPEGNTHAPQNFNSSESSEKQPEKSGQEYTAPAVNLDAKKVENEKVPSKGDLSGSDFFSRPEDSKSTDSNQNPNEGDSGQQKPKQASDNDAFGSGEDNASEITFSGDEEWKNSLPEELKAHPSFGPIKTLEDMAKGYVHAQKLVGRDKVTIPKEDATEDEIENFWRKVGKPESPEKYDLSETQNLDTEFLDDFKKAAHEANVLPSQAEKLIKWYDLKAKEELEKSNATAESQRKEAFDRLQKEWGQDFDQNRLKAKQGYDQFVTPSLHDELKQKGLTKDPTFLKVMYEVGKSLKEGSFRGEAVANIGLTPEMAQEKLNNILSDPKHPYMNSRDPRHDKAVEEVQRYFSVVSQATS